MTQKEVARKRNTQISIRIDESLCLEYKKLLEEEGVTITDDIEAYIRQRLGKSVPQKSNVLDFVDALARQKIEALEDELGKLKADWPQKTRVCEVG